MTTVSSLTRLACLDAAKNTAYTVELKINVLFYTTYLKVGELWMFFSIFLDLAAQDRRLFVKKDF
ncbi:MAG TPA: hypothetical protein V6D31_10445, partial [Candidatus Sericytochromatia bacterium]